MQRIGPIAGLSALLVMLLSLASPAGAAHEHVVEVWQPVIQAESLTIELYRVPYSVFGTRHNVLPLVAGENCIRTEREGGMFEDRNAAHLAGLEVRVDPKPDTMMGFWGDTLRVVLDASRLDVGSFADPPPPDTLVAATIECIRGTVEPVEGSPGNALHHLEITVEGNGSRKLVYDLRQPYTPRRSFDTLVRK